MVELNDDCWRHVIRFLSNDHGALFNLALTNKHLFHLAVADLYRSPLIQFRNLSSEAQAMLENWLLYQYCLDPLSLNHSLHDNSAYISAVLEASKLGPHHPTIDYISLVQEMPDSPSTASFCYNDGSDSGILLYRCMFGSKIKNACLSTNEEDLLEKSIGLLSGLEELTVEDCRNGGCIESMYEVVHTALTTHRAMYPGVLQKVTYRIFDDNGDRCRSDAKMMLTIRDAMGDRWCTDQLILEIPSDTDEDLLKLLKDKDLPNQVRFIEMMQGDWNPGDHWTDPLGKFLSRCRNLNSIDFRGFVPTNLLGWVFDENRSKVESAFEGNAKKCQWRSIEFTHTTLGLMFFEGHEEIQQLKNLWEVLISGFGHCVERLVFKTVLHHPGSVGLFPMLSLPESVHLPKLRELRILYPYFHRLAYSGIDQLRNLSFEVTRLQTDIGGKTKWDDWRLWTSVEELRFQADITDSEVDILCSHEVTLPYSDSAQEDDDPLLLVVGPSPRPFFLPKLKSVVITNKSGNKLNPNILLVGPNIHHLELKSPRLFLGHNHTNQAMDWSWFFQEASTRSMTFPKLKSLKTRVALELTPGDLMHHFLGIASFRNESFEQNQTGLVQQGCLFPSLEELTLGKLVDEKFRTTETPLPSSSSSGIGSGGRGNQLLESCFVKDMEKCLQQEFEVIEKNLFGDKSNGGGGGDGDGDGGHRILNFFFDGLPGLREMFWTQDGRIRSDQCDFKKLKKSGIVFTTDSYSCFFEVRLVLG